MVKVYPVKKFTGYFLRLADGFKGNAFSNRHGNEPPFGWDMLVSMRMDAACTKITKITKLIVPLDLVGKARITVAMAFDLDAAKSFGQYGDHICADLSDVLFFKKTNFSVSFLKKITEGISQGKGILSQKPIVFETHALGT